MQDRWVPAMYIIHIKQKVDFISKPDQDSQRIKYIYNYKYINFTAVCKIRLQWFQWIFWKLWEKLPVYVRLQWFQWIFWKLWEKLPVCHKSYTCLLKMLLKNQYENIENKLGTLQGILLNL